MDQATAKQYVKEALRVSSDDTYRVTDPMFDMTIENERRFIAETLPFYETPRLLIKGSADMVVVTTAQNNFKYFSHVARLSDVYSGFVKLNHGHVILRKKTSDYRRFSCKIYDSAAKVQTESDILAFGSKANYKTDIVPVYFDGSSILIKSSVLPAGEDITEYAVDFVYTREPSVLGTTQTYVLDDAMEFTALQLTYGSLQRTARGESDYRSIKEVITKLFLSSKDS
jgi:hypothetical protein